MLKLEDIDIVLNTNESYLIPPNKWHQGTNISDTLCSILEIQYGEECTEDDITRIT